jgi:hypothetical protein
MSEAIDKIRGHAGEEFDDLGANLRRVAQRDLFVMI